MQKQELCHDCHHHHHHASWSQLVWSAAVSLLLIAGILLANPESVQTNRWLHETPGVAMMFSFGFIASLSHCIMLIGAILLAAMSYYQRTGHNKWQILTVFHLGRLAGFGLGGLLLGYFGQFLQLNGWVGFIFTVVISLVMILFACDFLGIWCWHHQFEHHFGHLTSDWHPGLVWLAVVGVLTFFIPCGFSATAQLLALSSGSALTGAVLLVSFVSGTIIPLSIVALTGSFWQGERRWQQWLQTIVGWLIIWLALLAINEAVAEMGWRHLELLGHEHGHIHHEELASSNQSDILDSHE